jgi:hypothetical protein
MTQRGKATGHGEAPTSVKIIEGCGCSCNGVGDSSSGSTNHVESSTFQCDHFFTWHGTIPPTHCPKCGADLRPKCPCCGRPHSPYPFAPYPQPAPYPRTPWTYQWSPWINTNGTAPRPNVFWVA